MSFRALLAAFALLIVSCGGEDDPVEPQPDPPVVAGVSATTVAPGDTLTISGQNLRLPPTRTKLASPIRWPSDTVRRQFDGARRPRRPRRDRRSYFREQRRRFRYRPRHDHHARRSATSFVFGGLGPNHALTSEPDRDHAAPRDPVRQQRECVVLHRLRLPDFVGQYGRAAAAADRGPTRVAPPPRDPGLSESFDARRWSEARELVERVGVPERTARPVQTTAEAGGAAVSVSSTCSLRHSGARPTRPTTTTSTADLRYTGTKCWATP